MKPLRNSADFRQPWLPGTKLRYKKDSPSATAKPNTEIIVKTTKPYCITICGVNKVGVSDLVCLSDGWVVETTYPPIEGNLYCIAVKKPGTDFEGLLWEEVV